MSKIKLVEITRHEPGWKGTWYKTGQRHFVRQSATWPKVATCRWDSVDVAGGINETDCRIVGGFSAWLACRIKQLKTISQTWE
jgi:hypothetical protein